MRERERERERGSEREREREREREGEGGREGAENSDTYARTISHSLSLFLI
jgi:hypothetical protein